jgi:hypothetical protein
MTNIIDAATTFLSSAVNGAGAAFVGLAPSLPPLFILVSFFCKMLGVGMIFHALLKIKDARNKQNPAEMRPIIVELLAAVALINLNLFIATGAESLFGAGNYTINPLAYTVQNGNSYAAKADNIATAILSFIQFVGYISVARGITILNAASKGKQDASLGKGLTHVVGGCLASNITLTVAMLGATFLPSATI